MKTIKLTEQDFHNIVRESVNNILNEWFSLYSATDPSRAKDEEEYDRLVGYRKDMQRNAGNYAQDEHPQVDSRSFSRDYAQHLNESHKDIKRHTQFLKKAKGF